MSRSRAPISVWLVVGALVALIAGLVIVDPVAGVLTGAWTALGYLIGWRYAARRV